MCTIPPQDRSLVVTCTSHLLMKSLLKIIWACASIGWFYLILHTLTWIPVLALLLVGYSLVVVVHESEAPVRPQKPILHDYLPTVSGSWSQGNQSLWLVDSDHAWLALLHFLLTTRWRCTLPWPVITAERGHQPSISHLFIWPAANP